MTAQAADRNPQRYPGGDIRSVNAQLATAAATAKIYHGSMVTRGGTGGAFIAVATASGQPVLGFNAGKVVDNTSGADGALSVPDIETGRLVVKHAGTITAAHVGKPAFVVDDQTVAPTGSVVAGVVTDYLSATECAIHVDPLIAALTLVGSLSLGVQTNNQVDPYPYLVYTFAVPDAATGDIDIVVSRKIEVIDVVCQKQNGAGAANTMQVKNGANAISDAIACATDNAITRAGSIDDAQSTINAGGTLRLTATRAAGTRNALVTVLCLPRA
jgi:hypothetical protein